MVEELAERTALVRASSDREVSVLAEEMQVDD